MEEVQRASGRALVMAEVTARRFRLGSPTTAVVLFVLALALGVASLGSCRRGCGGGRCGCTWPWPRCG